MNAKKTTLILIFILLWVITANTCLAGETTISGTASCFMPQLLEFKTPATSTVSAPPALKAPSAMGASGNYNIQEEQRLFASEENIASEENTADGQATTVYTICAK